MGENRSARTSLDYSTKLAHGRRLVLYPDAGISARVRGLGAETASRSRPAVDESAAAADVAQIHAAPPMGNTGVQMTGVGLGWLQGTVKKVDPAWVVALVASAIGSEPDARPGGTRWYSESTTIGPHAMAAWGPRNRPGAVETYVEVRQSALDELGGGAALMLASDLQRAGARMSRADGYFDDWARHAEPATVAEAFRRGDALTHIQRMREIREFVASGPEVGAIPDGATTYLGSGKSAEMVRVYDKAAESGRVDAGVRWELQVRGGHAVRFVAGAVDAGDDLAHYVLACIRGLIDFRDRTGLGRGDRAPLLDWWAAIVGDADRVGLNGPAKVGALETRARWLVKQAAPSLALVSMAYGPKWLNGLLLEGEKRLTEPQLQLLGGRRRDGSEP